MDKPNNIPEGHSAKDDLFSTARRLTNNSLRRELLIAPEHTALPTEQESFLEQARRRAPIDGVSRRPYWMVDDEAKGFTMVEMLVVLVVFIILAAIALPSAVQMRNGAESSRAKTRVLSVWQAHGLLASCLFITPTQCGGLSASVPAPGTVTAGLYKYTYTTPDGGVTFTYTATGTVPGLPGYSINNSGALVQQ